jgi:biopolymer transport protein ExbD
MGRAKIPRKSTSIDMTAMCDVAFLLLSFFIMATKQKPPEAVSVNAPSSVSSKAAPEKSILITLTKDGKVFLMLGTDTKKTEVIDNLNTTRGLGLTSAEVAKLAKMDFIGMPLNQIKGILALQQSVPGDKMPGIPTGDSTNNELVDWLRSVNAAYANTPRSQFEEMVLLKGDMDAKYPDFKNIKYALKKNDMFKFRIVTNSQSIPQGSELYIQNKTQGGGSETK